MFWRKSKVEPLARKAWIAEETEHYLHLMKYEDGWTLRDFEDAHQAGYKVLFVDGPGTFKSMILQKTRKSDPSRLPLDKS